MARRLRYRFDTFMARGPGSVFITLTLAFVGIFLVVTAIRLAVFWATPDTELQDLDRGAWGHVYTTFLEMTDPGSMSEDIESSVAYKAAAILAGLAGIVMVSSLIGFVTTALDQKIVSLRRGHSKVVENGHTLILGWDPQQIVEIISALVIANESRRDACIVILSQTPKQDMDDHIRLRIPDLKTTRLVTRCGDYASLVDLDVVAFENCKSVILLTECKDSATEDEKSASDAKVIQTLLAITSMNSSGPPPPIVAEVFHSEHRRILIETFPDNVVTIDSSDILAKLLAQTSRSAGLSAVFDEILSFAGCEIYFFDSDWGGATFADASFRFPDGVPIGVRHSDGSLLLNIDPDYSLAPDDSILILADDDSSIEFRREAVAIPRELQPIGRRLEKSIERILVLGWTPKTKTLLEEFSDYLKPGSSADVMLQSPSPETRREIQEVSESLRGLEVKLVEKNRLSTDELMSLNPFEYDNIIILAQTDPSRTEQQIDSENIFTLLLLREIFRKHPVESASTKLITEVLDSQNQTLVAEAGVNDVIISNRLVGMMLAQISEEPDIRRVYDDLFEDRGSEIYIKPADLYLEDLPAELTFADVMRAAQLRKEICLGLKIKALQTSADENFGIKLIPEKGKSIRIEPEDSLILLAGDES